MAKKQQTAADEQAVAALRAEADRLQALKAASGEAASVATGAKMAMTAYEIRTAATRLAMGAALGAAVGYGSGRFGLNVAIPCAVVAVVPFAAYRVQVKDWNKFTTLSAGTWAIGALAACALAHKFGKKARK